MSARERVAGQKTEKTTDKVLPFSVLTWRILTVVINPQRVFRRIRDEERLNVLTTLLILFPIRIAYAFIHVYIIWRVALYDVAPDWLALSLGASFYDLNQWLCFVLGFLIIHQTLGGRLTSTGPVWVGSLYLVAGGLWVISFVVDTLFHFVLNIPPIEIHLPSVFAWLEKPFGGLWVRASWFAMFPWVSVAFWLMCRYVLGISGRRRLLFVIVLGVVLPFAGRLLVEQLPNVTIHLLRYTPFWPPRAGWVNLGTHGFLTVVLLLTIHYVARGLIRREPLS